MFSYRQGGIPTLMWHWGAPTKGEGYEQSKMTIDITRCFVEGTAEHKAMWADLKRAADWLTVMGACPDGDGFKATFEHFSIKHLPDQRRLEWLAKNK